ncbi:hypothetical protein [Krasilnikovia sp. MM14-A1259]|uniref:hypothetical protein n=1 Tax=Krasilnikovia sp. MM14-A1259 TaxID=3373539 RepID=UPI00382295D8
MRLTGIPLILLAGTATLLAAAGTVFAWSRGGRLRRLLTRTVGLTLMEALLVATIGLAFNRDQSFYPSWDALTGGSGAPPSAAAVDTPEGKPSPGTGQFAPVAQAWHLTEQPALITPAGYATRPDTTYPVIVVLSTPAHLADVRAAAQHLPGVVTVALTPTAATSAALLAGLPAQLRKAARVTDHNWAVVADPQYRALGNQMRGADRRFGSALGITGVKGWAAALSAAANDLPVPLALPLKP